MLSLTHDAVPEAAALRARTAQPYTNPYLAGIGLGLVLLAAFVLFFYYVVSRVEQCRESVLSRDTAGTPNPNVSACPAPPPDADGDGVADVLDVCPAAPNPVQEDLDGGGHGDLCDNWINVSNPSQDDSDRNGVGDACQY